jgi:hypothetical protein
MVLFYRQTWSKQKRVAGDLPAAEKSCLLHAPAAAIRAGLSLVSPSGLYLVFRQDLFLGYQGERWYPDMPLDWPNFRT